MPSHSFKTGHCGDGAVVGCVNDIAAMSFPSAIKINIEKLWVFCETCFNVNEMGLYWEEVASCAYMWTKPADSAKDVQILRFIQEADDHCHWRWHIHGTRAQVKDCVIKKEEEICSCFCP